MSSVAANPILRIVFTGFMGAGKSTLGALLAAELGWRFFDVDDELVRASGLSVAELFEQYGEAGFRRREEQAIAGLLGQVRAVIALGGGALESAATRDLLHRSQGTHVVFLETPLEVALDRCARQRGAAVRPVLRDQGLLRERFSQRLVHYSKAHQALSTDGRTPAELVRLLVAELATRV